MLRAFYQRAVKSAPGVTSVQLSEAYPGIKNPLQTAVHGGFVQQTGFHRLRNMPVGVSAFQVDPVLNSFGHCVQGVGAVAVPPVHVKVMDSPAVGHHQPAETPFSSQNIVDQIAVRTAGYTLETVVRYHYFLHPGLCYKFLEGGKITLPQVTLRHLGVEAVPVPFGP